MYRKKSRGWYKHKDFILIDLICLFLSLLIAHLIRNGSVQSLFRAGIYRNMISFVILADLFLIIIFESYKGVLRRGHYQELHSVIRQMILLELASGLYLFTVSDGHSFSRTVLYLMGVFYVFLSYGTRIAWKKHLIHKMAEGGEHSLYIVTNYDQAAKVIQNVLNGTMSLVGTRPILQDELLKYELHHRARIAIKPGITGMWQVSGRSDITDFEEVVRLDTEYISNWNFGLDIKILFKTVMTVLKREGSV